MPHKNPEDRKQYVLRNKEKRNKQARDWYASLPDSSEYNHKRYRKNKTNYLIQSREHYKRSGREKHLLKKYNINIRQFEEIFEYQGKVCGICKSADPSGVGRWYVDHDHNGEKEVRGILCLGCNRILGYFEKRLTLLEKCIPFHEYVQNPPARSVLKRIPLTRPTETQK